MLVATSCIDELLRCHRKMEIFQIDTTTIWQGSDGMVEGACGNTTSVAAGRLMPVSVFLFLSNSARST